MPAEAADIRRILAIELGAVVLSSLQDDREGTVVTARCGASSLDLSVLDLATKRAVNRSIAVADGARTSTARLLALVMAELVFISWRELSVATPEGRRSATAVRRAPTSDSTEYLLPDVETSAAVSRPHPRETGVPVRLVAVASMRKVLSRGDAMWGGGLMIGQDVFSWIGWSADGLYEHGSAGVRFTTNPVDLRVLTVGGGLLAHRSFGPLTVRAGVGLRVGMVQMQARGALDTQPLQSSKTELTTWGWPLIQGSVTLKLYGPLIAEFRTEFGYVVLPVSAMSASRFDLNLPGWWASTQFGLGIAL